MLLLISTALLRFILFVNFIIFIYTYYLTLFSFFLSEKQKKGARPGELEEATKLVRNHMPKIAFKSASPPPCAPAAAKKITH